MSIESRAVVAEARLQNAPCCPIAIVACYSGSSQDDHHVRAPHCPSSAPRASLTVIADTARRHLRARLSEETRSGRDRAPAGAIDNGDEHGDEHGYEHGHHELGHQHSDHHVDVAPAHGPLARAASTKHGTPKTVQSPSAWSDSLGCSSCTGMGP